MYNKAIILALLASVAHVASASAATQYVQARRAADFVNSIGVNTHLNAEWNTSYSDAANGGTGGGGGANAAWGPVRVSAQTTTNVSKIIRGMQFTGISHIRQALSYSFVRDRVMAITQGIPNLRINDQLSPAGGLSITQQLDVAAPIAWRIDSFEGMNESALGANYAGKYGASADCQYQIDLRNTLNWWRPQHNMWAPLLAPTVSGQNWTDFDALAPCAWAAEASNGHFYSDYSPPTQQLMYDKPYTNKDAPRGAPIYGTEAGFSTNNAATRGMTEDQAAKWTLATTLGYFSHGVTRTFLYELVDEQWQTPRLNDNWNWAEMEDHYGLFRSDYSAKPAATMLHAQNAIVQDNAGNAGSFSPGWFSYGVSNMPSSAYSTLLQKADGTFILAIWNEPWMFQPATSNSWGYAKYVAPTTVTVNFGSWPNTTSIYDPFNGPKDGSGNPTPQSTRNWTNQVQVTLTDHPVYLVIRP